MNFTSFSKINRTILFAILTTFASRQMTIASGADQQMLVSANNSFAFDLTAQIVTAQTGANIFISPFSVSSALQMVENGAAGQTKTEMEHVLHSAVLTSTNANAAFKELNRQLALRKDVTLNLANGIWFKQGFHLKPGFIADNKDFFKAELATVDFDNPSSAQTINDWADKQTQGKIQNVVQYPFDPATRVILANAIYFKGKWYTPFDKSQTQPRDFHLSSGIAKPVPMMVQEGKSSYQESPDFQAVRLPYLGGLDMEVFLPATNSSPQKLIESFRAAGYWQDNIMPGFAPREGTLMLPKFKLQYAIGLNESLEALGMKRAFESDAEFSAMADESLFISGIKQKSYVDVDDEGTEAAAVTTIEFEATAMMPDPSKRFEMIVDRPFLFMISDEDSGSILFVGIVNNPAAGGAD
jgi:serpin B